MKIFLPFILAGLALSGCASDDRNMEMAGDATVTTDPVSKEAVGTDSPWKTTWNGDWYYFESEENLQKFEAHPSRYVPSEGARRQERRTIYPHDLQ
jgi:YHS domain-containing protein